MASASASLLAALFLSGLLLLAGADVAADSLSVATSPTPAPLQSPSPSPTPIPYSPPNPFPDPPSPTPSDADALSPTPTPAPSAAPGNSTHPASENADSRQSSGEMSSGSKTGIGLGVILAAGVVVGGFLIYRKRRDNVRRSQYSYGGRRDII